MIRFKDEDTAVAYFNQLLWCWLGKTENNNEKVGIFGVPTEIRGGTSRNKVPGVIASTYLFFGVAQQYYITVKQLITREEMHKEF
jgi:hypothetical protein